MRNLFIAFFLLPFCLIAQFRLDSLPPEGVLLNQGWKWHVGDNPEWAKVEYDDTGWEEIDPTREIYQLANIPRDKPIWLRLKISHKAPGAYAVSILQSGACEVYLNGMLIQKIGKIDHDRRYISAYNPLDDYLLLKLDSLDNTLAVRYYFQPGVDLDPVYNIRYYLFSARLFDSRYILASRKSNFWPGFNIGVDLILFLVHGILFLYYQPLKANFWYSAWAFLSTLFGSFLFLLKNNPFLAHNANYIFFSLVTSQFSSFCLLFSIYLLLETKRRIYFFLFTTIAFVNIIGYYLLDFENRDILWFGSTLFSSLLTISIALDANRFKSRSGTPVLYGTLAYSLLWTLFLVSDRFAWGQLFKDILFHLATLSLPITMSALLGLKFRQVNLAMIHNLEQANQLYVEKQQILSTQNETLERQVTERTAELSSKNRELEIEAALERVRSRTMAMQKSNEVLSVAATLYEELLKLGFTYGITGINLIDEETSNMETWAAGFGQDNYPKSYNIPYFDHPLQKSIIEAWRSGTSYFVYHLAGAEKKAYDDFMFTQSDYKTMPEDVKAQMIAAESAIFSIAFMRYGNLLWAPTPLTEEKAQVLKRFAKVFEQTYTRFLDLQKAEAQAREAQIEAALERVRSRTMAMQSSNELTDVAGILFQQIEALGIKVWTTGFNVWSDDDNFYTDYITSPQGAFIEPYTIDSSVYEVFQKISEAKKRGDDFFVHYEEGVMLEETYRQLSAFNSKVQYEKMLADGFQFPKQQYEHFVFGAKVSLMFITYEPMPEAHDVFKRFGKVFDQTYTRFLDLQRKEEQALILAEEKRKVEQTLLELRSTQAQLIQSEKLASLGELTAGIAHEIQNPLNFVNNFAEVSAEMLGEMEEELDKGDTQEARAIAADLKSNLEKINHHGKRASGIVKSMLEHSRTSTGVKEPTDLNALADEYLRLAYHGLRAKDNTFNATMETNFDPDLPLVSVIPQDIGRVLLNLINNAFYAVHQRASLVDAPTLGAHEGRPYEPTVIVSTKRLDNAVEIRVQDNGPGIPESIREKIFQPFFTTKPTGQGTGLGLSLAYDIVVKGHGGNLMVESVEGEGSTFIIYFSLKITQS